MLESSLTPVVVFVVLWLMPIMVFPVFYALLLLLCFLNEVNYGVYIFSWAAWALAVHTHLKPSE